MRTTMRKVRDLRPGNEIAVDHGPRLGTLEVREVIRAADEYEAALADVKKATSRTKAAAAASRIVEAVDALAICGNEARLVVFVGRGRRSYPANDEVKVKL